MMKGSLYETLMWIFLPSGFLSIVADNADPHSNRLLVRSRVREHITQVFPGAEVIALAGSDYAYRAWVSRSKVATVLARFAEDLAYGNFKNEVNDDAYHDACLETWMVMRDYQEEQIARGA